jgi:diacylglycerol kinase family enzyme
MLSFCNGPRKEDSVAPGAKMDDGQITYLITQKLGRIGMLYFLPIVMSAKHLGYTRTFSIGETRRFYLETRQPVAIHVDGETFASWEDNIRQLEVTIIPAAIKVLCCEDLRLNGQLTSSLR